MSSTHSGCTILLTGLPAAGKSTVASHVLAVLGERGRRDVTLLDGDAVRRGPSADLGFSREDRDIHIRRVAADAAEKTAHGGVVLCAVIAPYDAARKEARRLVSRAGGFVLVHVSTPLDVCERRDPKGLYARARAGQLPHFTGVSDPYEPPEDAELVVDTSHEAAEEAAARIAAYLERAGYCGPRRRTVLDLWRAWARLGASEQWASFAAACLIPLVAAGLCVWRLDAILRRFDRLRPSNRPFSAGTIKPLVRAVDRAAYRGPYRGNCLSQSVTLWWLLRRRGINAQLQLGARLRGGRLEAHAWVECDGLVLNDRRDVKERFAPLTRGTRMPEVLSPSPGDSPS